MLQATSTLHVPYRKSDRMTDGAEEPLYFYFYLYKYKYFITVLFPLSIVECEFGTSTSSIQVLYASTGKSKCEVRAAHPPNPTTERRAQTADRGYTQRIPLVVLDS